jgi:hypothetical protein
LPPPAPLLPAASSAPSRSSLQCCGNRKKKLRFWFRLLKSYGSGSGFEFLKVMVPVRTFVKLRF